MSPRTPSSPLRGFYGDPNLGSPAFLLSNSIFGGRMKMKSERIFAGMKCEKAQRLFIKSINDQLEGELANRLQAHMYRCTACFSLYATCKGLRDKINEACGHNPGPEPKWEMEATKPSDLHQLLEKLENEGEPLSDGSVLMREAMIEWADRMEQAERILEKK